MGEAGEDETVVGETLVDGAAGDGEKVLVETLVGKDSRYGGKRL